MAVRTKEELFELIKARIGDQTDDDTISFLEDITDTISDYEVKANGDGVDWKEKYEENDRTWRAKYTERFFNKDDEVIEKTEETETEEEKEAPKTFEELFEEGE